MRGLPPPSLTRTVSLEQFLKSNPTTHVNFGTPVFVENGDKAVVVKRYDNADYTVRLLPHGEAEKVHLLPAVRERVKELLVSVDAGRAKEGGAPE